MGHGQLSRGPGLESHRVTMVGGAHLWPAVARGMLLNTGAVGNGLCCEDDSQGPGGGWSIYRCMYSATGLVSPSP